MTIRPPRFLLLATLKNVRDGLSSLNRDKTTLDKIFLTKVSVFCSEYFVPVTLVLRRQDAWWMDGPSGSLSLLLGSSLFAVDNVDYL